MDFPKIFYFEDFSLQISSTIAHSRFGFGAAMPTNGNIWKNNVIFKTIVLRCLEELEAGTGSVGKLRVSSFLFFHCFRWKHSLGVSKLRKHRCMVFWTNYWTKSRPSGNRVVVRTENGNMSYSPSLCASKYLSACRIFWPINISSTNKKSCVNRSTLPVQ